MKFYIGIALSFFALTVSAESVPDIRQATLTFIGVDGKKVQEVVTFENVDGMAVFQGDIILGKTEELLHGTYTQALTEDGVNLQGLYKTTVGAKWPNGRVPFVISTAISTADRNAITTYMSEIEAVARVEFVPRTNEAAYINIIPTSDTGICGSSVLGRSGGKQDLKLRCFTQRTITHELMHALGFLHEQMRADRDQYVTIHWSNIEPAHAYNFDKETSNVATHGSYDYSSIMHYHSTAFAVNPSLPTITAVNPNTPNPVIGGLTMTAGDKAALAHVYGPPLVQPYVTYAYIEWLRCNASTYQGAAEWDPVGSGLTYQLEQMIGVSWQQIYSGSTAFKAGINATPGQTTQFRVRALQSGVPGSWHNFVSYAPTCGGAF